MFTLGVLAKEIDQNSIDSDSIENASKKWILARMKT